MTIDAYFNPDFTWPKKLLFFVVALFGVFLSDMLLKAWNRLSFAGHKDVDEDYVSDGYSNLLLRFYELIIAGTSVMSFACAYVVLNHVYSLYQGSTTRGGMGAFLYIWGEWKDFALLLLICLSCVLNTIIDHFIIPLKGITRGQIATVRMLGMFYAIIILLWLNVIGDESEYSPVMMYYLGLMVGRFVYFDASFKDFLHAMGNMFLHLPMLILGLALSGLLSFFGFAVGFLLERNYYIVGVFYTHLFLLVAVFVFHHGRKIISRMKRR